MLKWLSGIDKRIVDDQTIMSWHDAVGHLEFKEARMALAAARQDASINYIEPKHIIQYVKVIKARLEREARVVEASRPVEAVKPWHPGPDRDGKIPASRPANMAAMEAAYDAEDPVAVAREIHVYREQLRAEGHPDPDGWKPANIAYSRNSTRRAARAV